MSGNRIAIIGVLVVLGIVLASVLWHVVAGPPAPAPDPRAARITLCQNAVRAKLTDLADADLPDYAGTPDVFMSDHVGEETTETFAFTTGSGAARVQRNAYCSYDPAGRLLSASVSDGARL